MMNNKRPYSMQQQQPQYNPRGFPSQGVPQQGPPPVSAPRNPNGPPNIRVQNGPPRPQPPQSQVQHQHQQHHAQMTGIQVSHSHPHAATGQQQTHPQSHHPQQQQPPQQLQFAYQAQAAAGNIVYHPVPYPSQQHNPPFLTTGPYQAIRFLNQPGMYFSQQPMMMTTQNQPTMQQHQQASHPGYYHPQYVSHPRLPMHSGSVHTSVAVPNVHSNTGHVQQPTHHSHLQTQQVPQPPTTNQTQIGTRNEGTPTVVVERKREKKILKIVDPDTGASVFGDTPISNPPAVTEPTPGTTNSGDNNGDISAVVTPTAEVSIAESTAIEPPVVVEEVVEAVVQTEKLDKAPVEENVASSDTSSKSKTAKSEFYQKISQASDDGRNSSTTSISQNPVISPASPIPATKAPEFPESPPIDSSKSQHAVATPIGNTSSDDSAKDSSYVSISPVPLEVYLTPQKSSPPGLLDDETFKEGKLSPSSPCDSASLQIIEDSTKDEVLLSQNNDEVQFESDISSAEVLDNSLTDQQQVKDVGRHDVDEFNTETSDSMGPNEDQAVISEIHQNGDVDDLEEGEVIDEESSGAAVESKTEDVKSDEISDSETKKEKIKYDREFLLQVSKGTHDKPPNLLPDVIRDANSQRHHGNPMKSPGGPRDQFNRMGGRGGQGGLGPKPGMGNPMMVGNYQRGNQHGMMPWPGPMMVPPAPPRPPKVIELTREEVKLHKAENAWKPAAIKHRTGANDQPKDQEEVITDDIVKKTRGILNKLTPENFEKLVGKFMSLPLEEKEERISKVIKVVFEKAVDEPAFSKEYAKMVQKVCTASQETSRKFKKLILDQCQQEFQNSNTDEGKIEEAKKAVKAASTEEEKKELQAEVDEMLFQSRRRSIGNVRFIGELFKLYMLTPKIMIECVGLLLATPDEENLECLCKLLTTVGQNLEESIKTIEGRVRELKAANQENLPKFIPEDKWMTKTFITLKNLSDNNKFSSRIRFALLDVVELRENHWKPRRDANAPKTIDEVRRDAYRQELEEKRQINNLPPPSMADQRGSSSRQGSGPPQTKKGDWNTVQGSNKSSRFQIKKPDGHGVSPVLAPPTQTWGRSNTSSSSSGMSSKPVNQLPPRFQQNRYQGLAASEDRLNANNQNQQLPPNISQYREPPQTPHFGPFGGAGLPHNRSSPAPSSTASSRENSRPVSPSPKDSYNQSKPVNPSNINETVKDIFEAYVSGESLLEHTIVWIREKFLGEQISDFVDVLSRQIAEVSKPFHQKAGKLVHALIKHDVISKEKVIKTFAEGVVLDLPDITVDVPMGVDYLVQFLVELFSDELNLDWLLSVGQGLTDDTSTDNNEDDEERIDYLGIWQELATKTLTVIRGIRNESYAQTLFAKTTNKNRIPIEELPWLGPMESIAQKMVPVLSKTLSDDTVKEAELRQMLKENSWDLREEFISCSFMEAVCLLSWKSDEGEWNHNIINKLIPLLLPVPNDKRFPILWKQVDEFITRHNIDKVQKEQLWGMMYSLNLATSREQISPE